MGKLPEEMTGALGRIEGGEPYLALIVTMDMTEKKLKRKYVLSMDAWPHDFFSEVLTNLEAELLKRVEESRPKI